MFVVIGVSFGLVPVHAVDRQSAESHASCFCQRESSDDMPITTYNIQGGPKIGTIILYALTLPNIKGFSKLFHCQNQEKICNNAITKDPTTPQVCRYTTL